MADTPAKATKPRKPFQAVAQRGPDLDALDRILTETAQQMAPMVSRVGSAREKAAAELRILEADRAALDARENLVDRHYSALKSGFSNERADIDATIAMYRNALLDGAEQERTAA